MADPHPLDRPVWNALNDRQTAFGEGDGRARRFAADVNLFGAAADASPAALTALAALLPEGGVLGTVEPTPPPLPPGARLTFQATIVQMLIDRPLTVTTREVDWMPLGEEDANEMVALAMMTRPGPFFRRTHLLGRYVGIRRAGKLVAMAGERMKPNGFTEISAVCTHEDWRGQGFGPALVQVVLGDILARGETAFLHAYPDHPAIDMYRAMGFRIRRELTYTVMER